jgi:NAD+ kinase|tara:strand:+ start:40 stop:813 length:774 start_codon:yes stop_codon:yes gene_type:complete
MKKYHFIFDKNKKAQNYKRKLSKKFKNYSPFKSSTIIVFGGDGFMLKSLKKYYKYKKPFYGINCGTYGFLMNKTNIKNLERKISKSKKTTINSLAINCIYGKRSKKKLLAFNEISIFRQSKQTASLKISVGRKPIIKKLIGDGVLVSTPAGSTAYNLSVHGPILALNSGKLAITPISPFRPRRWKGKIISNKAQVKIKNLNSKKRPIAAVADNIELRNVKSLSIKRNQNINISLLFDSNRSLVKRIKNEIKRQKTTN